MQEILKMAQGFMIERGWDNLKPGDLAKSIMIEGAELLELFQWVNPTAQETLGDEEKMKRVKEELADVFIYALDLAVTLDLNPEDIIKEKMNKNAQKYPPKIMLSSDWYEQYQKIKQEKRGE